MKKGGVDELGVRMDSSLTWRCREGRMFPPGKARRWRGVNSELLGWAAGSAAKSLGCMASRFHRGSGSRAP